MTAVYEFTAGSTPLLISVPHDGREIPEPLAARMTPAGTALTDTDWDVARLYRFADAIGAGIIVARYSRYVVDLNRSADDEVLYPGQRVTGLCPTQTFAGEAIYQHERDIGSAEKQDRIEQYWRPYHDRLAATLRELKDRHGVALLWDAHSIPSKMPSLFPGELPELSLGSNDGASCDRARQQAVFAVAAASTHSAVLNGRFKGGYITRHYGDPENSVHALQLEIAQRAYREESEGVWHAARAAKLRATLERMLVTFRDGLND